MVQGSQILGAGARLGPAQLGLLAAVGRDRVRCRPKPRVVVLSTGSELVDPVDQRARLEEQLALRERLSQGAAEIQTALDERQATLDGLDASRELPIGIGDGDADAELLGEAEPEAGGEDDEPTGVVDGEDNVPTNILTQRFYEVQKHLTISHHGRLTYALVTNKTFWNSLPQDVRAQLDRAVKESTELPTLSPLKLG